MNIQAIIIDDEKNARETLELLIKEHFPHIVIVAEAGTMEQAISEINSINPDLVFLDVRLKTGSGFDILEKVQTKNFEVIFTTAYEEYALKAIKFSALDYLLKPINHLDLKTAIEKFIQNKKEGGSKEKLETFVHNAKLTGDPKIVLSSAKGFRVARAKNILRCLADGSYTWIHFLDGDKYLTTRSMKEFEELLAEYHFFRCHQSHLINLNCVKEYRSGQNARIEMMDGTILELSKHRKGDFLTLFAAR